MPIQHSCFISYPHGQDDVLVPLVMDFVAGLRKEIHAQTRKTVWIDLDNLQGGNRLDEEVGPDLCKSACMIVIYTPLYFDAEHTYCARELKGMHDLEEQRLKLLKDKGKGLIIPIILRGEKKFPVALSTKRLYYDFTQIEFNNRRVKIHAKYAKEIRQIAEYVVERCEQLDEVDSKLIHDCEEYCLPTHEQGRRFVEELLQKKIAEVRIPFPGRTTKAATTADQKS